MKTTILKKLVSKKSEAKTEQKVNAISQVNQKQFENVLLNSPNIFIILEGFPEMIISFANEPLYKSWSKTTAILGKPLMEVVPEIKDQTFPAFLQQVFKTGKTHYSSQEKAVIHIDGNPFDKYYNYVYQPIFNNDKKVTGVTVMATDITELVLSQKKIEESEKQKAYLLKLSDALRSYGRPAEIEGTATKIAMDFTDADRCYYCTREEGNAIVLSDAFREGLTSLAAVYPVSDFALLMEAIDSGHPFVVDDVLPK
jgi:PAS domain S-box-containing protein